MANLLNQLGLVLNIAGSLLIAISFGKHIGGGYNIDKNGKKVFLASLLHPIFYWPSIKFPQKNHK